MSALAVVPAVETAEPRSLDVLWRELSSLGAKRIEVESPELFCFGSPRIAVSLRFQNESSESSLRIVGKGPTIHAAIEDALVQTRAFSVKLGGDA
jgi:hypothetical protein